MRIRALPISEWSTGEVCGHVCKRGSRDRRVSGICVVSTLAVCMRSSLNAGPDDVSGRRWSATNGSRGSSRVEFRPRARVGDPLSSTEGYLSRHSHRVLQPPANQCRLLATIDTRRTARTSQPRGDRWAGEASGTDIQLGPDGRREGAISRGSNFGLRGGEEGKAPVFRGLLRLRGDSVTLPRSSSTNSRRELSRFTLVMALCSLS